MDRELKEKEKTLERLTVEDEIEEKKMSTSQKKAVEHEMKQKYGRDWKKILGVVRGIRPDREAIQDLYSLNPDLREFSRPKGVRSPR